MRVLCLCDEGNNRSVTLASNLKYLGHDVLSAGLRRNSPETLELLFEWAEYIITTDTDQFVPPWHSDKVHLWHIGPDKYPRAFNPQLLAKVKALIAQYRGDLTP
jgi:hypothetical protein